MQRPFSARTISTQRSVASPKSLRNTTISSFTVSSFRLFERLRDEHICSPNAFEEGMLSIARRLKHIVSENLIPDGIAQVLDLALAMQGYGLTKIHNELLSIPGYGNLEVNNMATPKASPRSTWTSDEDDDTSQPVQESGRSIFEMRFGIIDTDDIIMQTLTMIMFIPRDDARSQCENILTRLTLQILTN